MRDRIFVVYDGTILHQTSDGRIHEREVIELPHVHSYLLQPVPRAWRSFEDARVGFVRRRRYFTFMQAFLLRPFAVARDDECGRLLLVAWRRLLGIAPGIAPAVLPAASGYGAGTRARVWA